MSTVPPTRFAARPPGIRTSGGGFAGPGSRPSSPRSRPCNKPPTTTGGPPPGCSNVATPTISPAGRPPPSDPSRPRPSSKISSAFLSAEIDDPQLLSESQKADPAPDRLLDRGRGQRPANPPQLRSTLRAIDTAPAGRRSSPNSGQIFRRLHSRTPSANDKPAIGLFADKHEPSTNGKPTTAPPHLPSLPATHTSL